MFSSRAMQSALKLSSARTASSIFTSKTTSAIAARSTTLKAITTTQIRPATSTFTSSNVTPTTADEAHSLLVQQRLKRPLSPHLSIYQPQLTWYLSSANRITGAALSGATYLFFIGYLISPYAGWHLESQTLAAAFAALPFAAKFGIKTLVAAPFTFHSWNGIRHLIWDTAKELHLKGVYRTGYAVLGLTAVSTLALALM